MQHVNIIHSMGTSIHYTIGETDLEVANIFANFEASGKHFVEATDQRVAGRQDNHLSAERGHPRLKHLPWSNGEQGPKESDNHLLINSL